MTNQLTIPATIREQFEALMPYVVNFRPIMRDRPEFAWELRLCVPEDVLSGSIDEAFLRRNRLTLDMGQEPLDFTRDYITIPRRDIEIVLKYNTY